MREKGHIYPKTDHQSGQNIKNFHFWEFFPFVDPLMSYVPSLTGYDVSQYNLDDL